MQTQIGPLQSLEHTALEMVGGTMLTLGPPRAGKPLVLTLLGSTLLALFARKRPLAAATAGLTGAWLIYRGMRGRRRDTSGVDRALAASITVGRPASELNHYWREPALMREILQPFSDVTAVDDERMTWHLYVLGRDLSWHTRVVEDRPGELVRWESLPDASVTSRGEVRFSPAPGDRGTEVKLRLELELPGNRLQRAALTMLGEVPHLLVLRALRRFKSLAETGEVPTIAPQPAARKELH